MVYKNFLLRLLFSIILILIYFVCLRINFNSVFYLILSIYFLIFFEIFFYFNKNKPLLIIYILFSFIFFVLIDFNEQNFLTFNLFIITVITFDMFCYIFGKFFGKIKLTKISPNKTVEGLFGGFILSFLSSLIFANYNNMLINFELLIFINLIIFTAFLGDIIESLFKRKNNLKNSSDLIPGHGGVFDRFDSFLFSIIFYSIFINF